MMCILEQGSMTFRFSVGTWVRFFEDVFGQSLTASKFWLFVFSSFAAQALI